MNILIKSGTGKNPREYQGKTYVEQSAGLDAGGDFVLPFKLNREQGKELKPGNYKFGPGTFGTDKHGNLVIGRVELVEAK
jgi:hypothetical protein